MVNVLIFFVHIFFAAYIFITVKRTESLSDAFYNLALIVIIFSIGWSIISFLSQYIFEPGGFAEWFDRSTIDLTILTIGEFLFYRKYFADLISNGKEKL